MTGVVTERGLVLVVEDEPQIAELQRRYLVSEGYGVHVEGDGEAALAALSRLHPVAVVLDVGLPGVDGISVCRAMRERGDWTPVLFVTARDDEVDRVLGRRSAATTTSSSRSPRASWSPGSRRSCGGVTGGRRPGPSRREASASTPVPGGCGSTAPRSR